ncbi:hypothetical protein [Methylobacterium soli]|uniref:Uncharacterized protein n=1 Tax=Methylobacterium soli TaxID=553447 RepID=A0A6L3SWA7_9HYPH|nr:hypothetical protein [Methylobacterium soli]KAB1076429.1 hypothetical protein F6X53_23150 [Methylobacterium soli]GJE43476.1 hypothetical protein AEGHOMDF_2655 [Methylobacterium soli]
MRREGESAASTARSAQTLSEIADTLGMPTSVFSLRETPNARSVAGSEAANECGELVRAYLGIRDPDKRRRLLELVRSMGDEE